jgi:hypothetical protein
MAKPSTETLKRYEKVVAAVDLPIVPEGTPVVPAVPVGTPGKVLLVAGVTWIRYRVLFENGVELGTIDRSALARRDEWAARLAEERRGEREAVLD